MRRGTDKDEKGKKGGRTMTVVTIGWNNPSSCCCNRMAPVAKLDASHSRQKRPDLEGKASMGVEVTVFFNVSKACCSAAPHDQSSDFQVSGWRGQAISDKFWMNL